MRTEGLELNRVVMIADETMKNLARMAAGDWPLVDTPTPALKGGCVVC